MSEIKTNKISPRKGTTQTIGDSGDTVSIPCGVTTTNAGTITTAGISGGTINNTTGTISGLAGVVEWDTTAKTTGFTAVSNKGYFCNTTSATFTVTLPASPTAGDVIALKDYANTFDTNKLSIAPNGNKIQGSTDTFESTDEGAALQFIYVDATRGWVLTDASKASDIIEEATFIVATGGTITTCGNDKIHTFTGPGTFTVSSLGNGPTNPLGGPNNVDYLVVAGGGSGGAGNFNNTGVGGGGAGGYRASGYGPAPLQGSALPVTVTGYPITVGGGGAGQNPSASGVQGSNSIFSTITSSGGGGGAGPSSASTSGGSGGGSQGGSAVGAGNTPPVSPPQGNAGGASGPGCQPPNYGGGAGGGATAVGGTGGGPGGGVGGTGATNAISGSATAYAGGGGGGAYCSGVWGPGSTCGTGGRGSSGPGGQTGGATNTGGGGGGSNDGPGGLNSGAGGSGIVIIRYRYQ